MTCCLCGRTRAGGQLPRGWKLRGRLVFCRECRRWRRRIRFVTMAVAEPVGAARKLFRAAINGQAPLLLVPDQAWDTLSGNGRGSTAKGFPGELPSRREPGEGAQTRDPAGDSQSGFEITFHIVHLLREGLPHSPMQRRGSKEQGENVEEMSISDLRMAIRANAVSFPAQVPTFPACGLPDLQHKLVHLYFINGWNCVNIADRYGLPDEQVRRVLNDWKRGAASAGYLQRIPSADVMMKLDLIRSLLHPRHGEAVRRARQRRHELFRAGGLALPQTP